MLEDSASELERLASDVAAGTMESVETLDHAFADAQQALATYYHYATNRAIGSNKLREAGHALSATVKAFEYAVEWSGHTLETGAKLTIDSALLLSGKLIQGTGFVAKEAGKIVADLGSEVEKFGKMIEPISQD